MGANHAPLAAEPAHRVCISLIGLQTLTTTAGRCQRWNANRIELMDLCSVVDHPYRRLSFNDLHSMAMQIFLYLS